MSLVQAYISEECIVVGGEGRAVLNNGNVIENFQKVFKLNNTTIIGIAGTIQGNIFLFKDYLNKDFTLTQLAINSSYNEIVSNLTSIFNNNKNFFDLNNVISIVCGWDGNKMVGKTFFSQCDNPKNNGIHEIVPDEKNIFRIINCGLNIHHQNALKYGQNIPCINPLQAKNIFKNVVSAGIKIDNSINDNIRFEKIRRSDFI